MSLCTALCLPPIDAPDRTILPRHCRVHTVSVLRLLAFQMGNGVAPADLGDHVR